MSDPWRSGQQVFGIDVNGWQAGSSQLIGGDVFGYPVNNLKELPAGKYYAQVLFHKYETFNLVTGHEVLLPMDRGEGHLRVDSQSGTEADEGHASRAAAEEPENC